MIQLLDTIIPFLMEIFKVKKTDKSNKFLAVLPRMIGYSIIAFSLLANYYLVKKVYHLTVTTYRLSGKLENYNNMRDNYQKALILNQILVGIIEKDIDRFPKMILPTDADLSGKTLPDKLDIQKELNIGNTNNSSTEKASDNKTTDAKDKTNVSQDDAPAVRAVDIVKKKPIDAPK